METAGLRILRKNMWEFIKADAREITISRPTKVETPGGSWTEREPEILAPQTVRVVPAKRRLGSAEENSQVGALPTEDFVIVAKWDADIQRDDEFQINGDDYKVQAIEPHTDERDKTDRLVVQVIASPNRPVKRG